MHALRKFYITVYKCTLSYRELTANIFASFVVECDSGKQWRNKVQQCVSCVAPNYYRPLSARWCIRCPTRTQALRDGASTCVPVPGNEPRIMVFYIFKFEYQVSCCIFFYSVASPCKVMHLNINFLAVLILFCCITLRILVFLQYLFSTLA